MKIGIIPNITKTDILDVVSKLSKKFLKADFEIILSKSLLKNQDQIDEELKACEYLPHAELSNKSDMVISIGGDGTLLTTAYDVRESNTPIIGLNFGKLGFLAEFEIGNLDDLIDNIKNENYFIGERTTLEAICLDKPNEKLFAVNDIVIDKGRWSKMIQLTIKVDDDYVSTFSADGIIISTPTGSTGYSLSAGGPILSPEVDGILINPISPHTLTMRPLVLSAKQKITITVESPYKSVQINSDGQRVNYYEPPVTVEVCKGQNPLRLLHANKNKYYETLRNKLFWGLDIRNSGGK